MKMILTQQVPHIGEKNQIINVKNGFARNFLLPRGLAKVVTKGEIDRIKKMQERKEELQKKTLVKFEKFIKERKDKFLTLSAKVGESGKLFGSITKRDIARAIFDGFKININPENIGLSKPIKEIGKYLIEVNFGEKGSFKIKLKVGADTSSGKKK
ncbi:50S ribosomal protein L9 [bacterium (Candidatus Torokbacteria) CG_4_10_14_0_2_um_filter_35_8]|nr:MAG: 50S ribosomal protein L9 [bacterium (Candidatus Torokbacteria) CG_4_10_14_0_2_um_filter_35_8]